MYFQDSNVLQIANTCKFIELSPKTVLAYIKINKTYTTLCTPTTYIVTNMEALSCNLHVAYWADTNRSSTRIQNVHQKLNNEENSVAKLRNSVASRQWLSLSENSRELHGDSAGCDLAMFRS